MTKMKIVKIGEKGKRCTYNVTLRRIYETIAAVEKQYALRISVCECMRACLLGGVRVCAFLRACVCLGARSVAYACARVTLLTHHATLRHIVICDLSGSTTFVDIIS